jgi:hypothetical protein
MDTTIRVTKLASHNSGVRYSIDSPKEATIQGEHRHFIKLKGWFFSEDTPLSELVLEGASRSRLAADIERPDVCEVYSNAPIRCGFETFIEVGVDARFGFSRDGQVEWLASITFEKVSVISGQNDYLFLDHDSNRSVSQYRGEVVIDKANLISWASYFAKVHTEQNSLSFKFAFLIAPAKEYIFPDFYPVMKGSMTPADQFLANFSDRAAVIDPTDALIKERNFTYSKVDTHWTHYGARVAARLVCTQFGQTFVNPDYNYKFTRISGDLGSKIAPQQTEVLPQPDYSSLNQYRIFDNKILNRGRVHVYEHAEAVGKPTCVIFGDSFSTSLVIYLTKSFSRVVHVFSGADIDWEIVHHEKPDYLLAEMTTRFFIKSPSPTFSLKTELHRKCSVYNESQRKAAITNLNRFDHASIQHLKSIAMNALVSKSGEST